jgi:hypothetical protein
MHDPQQISGVTPASYGRGVRLERRIGDEVAVSAVGKIG